jgi:hypothetical protein
VKEHCSALESRGCFSNISQIYRAKSFKHRRDNSFSFRSTCRTFITLACVQLFASLLCFIPLKTRCSSDNLTKFSLQTILAATFFLISPSIIPDAIILLSRGTQFFKHCISLAGQFFSAIWAIVQSPRLISVIQSTNLQTGATYFEFCF